MCDSFCLHIFNYFDLVGKNAIKVQSILSTENFRLINLHIKV